MENHKKEIINIEAENSRIAFKIKVIEEELDKNTANHTHNESTELEGLYSFTYCNLKFGINKCFKIIRRSITEMQVEYEVYYL